MAVPVIITGACGRMGATLVRMVKEDAELTLAGATERAERLPELAALGCPVAPSLSALPSGWENSVVIDFTAPEASLANAATVASFKAAHVIGTTGFSDEQRAALEETAKGTRLFWSPNMSVGVNVLLKVLPKLTQLLGEEYDIELMEIHHNKKKDSPSGTALRLGECVAEARGRHLNEVGRCCREGIIGERPRGEIGMQTLRGGDVVGVHTLYFMGPGERIEVTHQAHSRENFAAGALRAAKWLHAKTPGKLYGMQDVL